MTYITDGLRRSRIMIVGEAPGVHEEREGRPFVGASGQEFDRMLHEAGILRSDCFITNVVHQRPPGNNIEEFYLVNTKDERTPGPIMADGIRRLERDIEEINPELIITLGDTSTWALTGNRGITKWRGSQLLSRKRRILPTYHPASILRQWSWRFPAVQDLKRAKSWFDAGDRWQLPAYNFTIRPSFAQVMQILHHCEVVASCVIDKPLRLSCDIETRAGHIDCVGIGWSETDALCVPIMCKNSFEGYWTLEEELAIIEKFRRLFKHPNIQWIFQNGLYDLQYFARYWYCFPRMWMDTMLAHHVCFAELPKGLDFLSSLYCKYHLYWKDDGKEREKHVDDDQEWVYNCTDCVRTWEAAEGIHSTIEAFNVQEPFEQQMRTAHTLFKAMLRGIRVDKNYKASLVMKVDAALSDLEAWIENAVGHPLSVRSPKQLNQFFYDELGMGVVKHKKTKKPTVDKTALEKFERWQPLLKPLTRRMMALRSGGAIASTFIEMKLDPYDQRARCSYNVAGTETYRLSSRTNAFGSGGNLQNIPRPHDPDDEKDVLAWLPPIRNLFTPDPGYAIIDIDLKKADVFIVAKEADDNDLLSILLDPRANLHLENAKAIFSNERLTKDSKEYTYAKVGVHATNYGASARTLAVNLNISVREAEHFQSRWFAAHPGIKKWHERVEDQLQRTRSVHNAFGYFRHFFDRIESLLPEALAWTPQSTVGLVTNRALNNIDERIPYAQILLQTHDSVTFQAPLEFCNGNLYSAIYDCMQIPIPYTSPLIIPYDIKASRKSWGECEAWDGGAIVH